MWYIYTMEYYSAVKNDDFITYTHRLMDGTRKYHPMREPKLKSTHT